MFNVYFRNNDKTLGCIKVDGVEDHKDAILEVQEALLKDGGWVGAILAVINGGKK
jgi:hypothetical protein